MQRLLDLDGMVMDLGGGYWIKIEARRVEPAPARPHGLNYSHCLLSPQDERLVCFDNAHPIASGTGPAKKRSATNDHVHKGRRVRPYRCTDAEALMHDFWSAVDNALKGTA